MDIPYDNVLFVLHICAAIAMAIRLIYRKLNVSMTLAWILLITFLPVVGFVLYWLFGSHKLSRQRRKLGQSVRSHYIRAYEREESALEPEEIDTAEDFGDLSRAIEAMTGFSPMQGNIIKLLDGDEAIFESFLADIADAEKTLFAEFYIIDPKGLPLKVLESFEAAAKRGVDVKILADAFGSRPFFKSEWPERLRSAGVEVVNSLAVNLVKSISKRTDLRNHRKILVIDQTIGYIGSCNLTDPELFKPDDGMWVDLMARIEGPFAESLSAVMAADFIYDKVGGDLTQSDLGAFPSTSIHAPIQGPAVAQLIPSGPEMAESVIYEVIVSTIFAANRSIRITTPYFVPDEAIMLALTNAARRGVEVELIVPAEVDSIMVRYASASSYETLLAAGVRIGMFHGGMLHTKSLIVDDDISLVGTVNMDMRSFHLNLEVTMIVYDADFNTSMNSVLDGYVKDVEWLDEVRWSKRGRWQSFKENTFRLASPLL